METPKSYTPVENAGLEKQDYAAKNAYGLVSAYRLQSMTVGFDEENPNNLLLKWKTRKRAEEILHATGVDKVVARTDAMFAKKRVRGLEAVKDPELVQCVTFETNLQNEVFNASDVEDLKKAMQKATLITGQSSPVPHLGEKKEVNNSMDNAHLDTKYSVVSLPLPSEKSNVAAKEVQENKSHELQVEKKEIKNIMDGAHLDPHYGTVSLLSKGARDMGVGHGKAVETKPEVSKDNDPVPAATPHTKPQPEPTTRASSEADTPVVAALHPDKSWATYRPDPASHTESSPERIEKIEAYLRSRGKKAIDGLKKYGLKAAIGTYKGVKKYGQKAVVGTYRGVKKYGPGALTETLEVASMAPWKLRVGLGAGAALLAVATGGATAFLSFTTSTTFFASEMYARLKKSSEEKKKKDGVPFTEQDKQRIALLALLLGFSISAVAASTFSHLFGLAQGTHAVSGGSLSTATGGSMGDFTSVSPDLSSGSPHVPDLAVTGDTPDIVESMRQSQAGVEQAMRESARSMDTAIREASGMYPQADSVSGVTSAPDVPQGVQQPPQPAGVSGQTMQQAIKEGAGKMDAMIRGSSGMYPS